MRLSASALAFWVALLVSPWAAAEELPQRWVSAGGALSEWVAALGAEPKLVGVDTTSQHPESLKALPSIGYQRQLSAEGILSLRPDILVGTEEMGPPPVLAQIRSAGVKVELFSAQADLPTLQRTLRQLGQLLGREDQAGQLFSTYQQRLEQQRAWIALILAQQAEYLLLDEPINHLDLNHQIAIMDLLTDLRLQGKTLVVVLHDLNLAARYADHLVLLHQGKILRQGRPQSVLQAHCIEQAYGQPVMVVADPLYGAPWVIPKGRYVSVSGHEHGAS